MTNKVDLERPEVSLTPPPRGPADTVDPGAHELGPSSSDSEEHFSDAHSAPPSAASPIPRTRVEKVSDEPSYGEVPGTDAYRKREGDAEPDEIAIIPDDVEKERHRKRSASMPHPGTPGGQPIPTTILEEAEDISGQKDSTPPHRRHRADSRPDIVLRRDGSVDKGESSEAGGNETFATPTILTPVALPPESETGREPGTSSPRSLPPSDQEDPLAVVGNAGDDKDGFGEDDNDFGDDFDDFEGAQDAEFDDFQEGFDDFKGASPIESTPVPLPAPVQPAVTVIPMPKIWDVDPNQVALEVEPYISALFPSTGVEPPKLPPLPQDKSVFISQRSASLWSQLVAPPPLQPPDWIRSRIRRAFLVSLGVPVDLDEILPASKQKKLVLPSVGTPRGSFESRSMARLKNSETNASSTSVDSQGKPTESSNRRTKGPVEPKLDIVRARQLCATTKAALGNMNEEELNAHIQKLETLKVVAEEALTYWTKKTDEKIGDREAFEGVIENLVKHARKVRK